MKNLENFGVQELHAKQAILIDGGYTPSTLNSAVYISMQINHAIVDFFAGAIDRFNMFRN